MQMAVEGGELRFKQGRRAEVAIPMQSISHVNVVNRERCEFAVLARGGGGLGGGLLAFRAADFSTMQAWVAVLQSKEAPTSPPASPERPVVPRRTAP